MELFLNYIVITDLLPMGLHNFIELYRIGSFVIIIGKVFVNKVPTYVGKNTELGHNSTILPNIGRNI